MSNVLNIARKEFADFLSSRFILVVTLIFLITFLISRYSVYTSYNTGGALLVFSGGYTFIQAFLNTRFWRRSRAPWVTY